MANIREHDAWATDDKTAATYKAKALVEGAINRVKYHTALEPIPVDINPNTLVVGGGIAGITAALELANAGYHVYLVERSPSIGGHMAQLDKTFPTLDCSACILTPKMVDVGQHENITLLAYSEVEGVEGYIGNFTITVRKKARYVDPELCNACNECAQVCPVVRPDEYQMGLLREHRVRLNCTHQSVIRLLPAMNIPTEILDKGLDLPDLVHVDVQAVLGSLEIVPHDQEIRLADPAGTRCQGEVDGVRVRLQGGDERAGVAIHFQTLQKTAAGDDHRGGDDDPNYRAHETGGDDVEVAEDLDNQAGQYSDQDAGDDGPAEILDFQSEI
jgi:NAD-dependent dihydropyrimidine dehydrogenase PreA subunit